MMKYRGYTAAVRFDYDAGVFHGKVADTRDVIVFEGDSVARLERESFISL